jgi:hypothetical protein
MNQTLVTGEHPDATSQVRVGDAILTVAAAGAAQPNDTAAAAQGNAGGKAWLSPSRWQESLEYS